MNRSPWLHELARTRTVYRLDHPRSEDVVIVGGGIAGIMTAAFTLLSTNRSVLLLEATHLAHGATGHNAGQLVSYFERPLPDLVRTYGLQATRELVLSVESAWDLLDLLVRTFSLETPIHRFLGYAALTTKHALRAFLTMHALREQMGLTPHILYVDETVALARIPSSVVRLPCTHLTNLVEANVHPLLAVHAEPKGTTNSARLTEELAHALTARFPDRFAILEETPVKEIHLRSNTQLILTEKHPVEAKTVVLCTNGFESFHLFAEDDARLDTRFHASVEGTVGSMAGYLTQKADPLAISFLNDAYAHGNAYPYFTRRPHTGTESLVCWGGPEERLPEAKQYARNTPLSPAHARELRALIKQFRPHEARKPFLFEWHGLMGYTRDRLRLIGPDPKQAQLFYNLGCNGVGILPSIYGGQRIAKLLAGEKLAQSLFDPSRSRGAPRSLKRRDTRRKG